MKIFKIGFESHIMVASKEKLFCNCRPNQQNCSICKGEAGFFCGPVNEEAIKTTLKLVRVLDSKVNKPLKFYRKVYLYHDSLTGFQRSQNPQWPFAQGGFLSLLNGDEVEISHVLLEEDPAKTYKKSIDSKRSGNPLIELVTKPIEGPKDKLKTLTLNYLRTLRRLCLDLKICTKQRSIKTDFNISYDDLRVELKNISSFETISKAIDQFQKLLDSNTLSKGYYTIPYKKNIFTSLKNIRNKEVYVYIPEYNQSLQNINFSVEKETKTLYYNKDVIRNYFKSYNLENPTLQYSFTKLYTEAIKTDPQSVKSLLEKNPHDAYKILTSRTFTPTEEFVKEVENWFETFKDSFEESDYSFKTQKYLKNLKILYQNLKLKEIRFNSTMVNEKVKDILSSYKNKY